MKKSFLFFDRSLVPFFSLLFLLSCGKNTEIKSHQIQLHFRLPASLQEPSRKQRFLDRAEFLEVSLKAKSGARYENRFASNVWSSIQVPDMGFPNGEGDVLNISVSIWDKKKDGTRRTFPMLEGKGILAASELNDQGVTKSVIALHLKIQPENFDD